LKDFDMIKAVANERAHPGLTNKKELAICFAIDYIASTNKKVEVGDGCLSIGFESKFSCILNPQWATDMYNTYGDDMTDEDYMKPHFMEGYIKREDYLYISIEYLKYHKEMAYSGTTCQMKIARSEGEIATALIQISLVGRALMQFDDIITMNAPHHTKFEHAYVLDVHFSKTTIESDVTAAPAK